MADRPILFSAPMIRALLAGRKTQTRRVLKPQPVPFETSPGVECKIYPHIDHGVGCRIAMGDGRCGVITRQKLPFCPGDRLWVREVWRSILLPAGMNAIEYRADGAWRDYYQFHRHMPVHSYPNRWRAPHLNRWSSSIHMPRWASRLTLIVEAVKVERLQDISEEDAEAEGATSRPGAYSKPDWSMDWSEIGNPSRHKGAPLEQHDIALGRADWAFASYWNSIHGPGAWDANPWVCALTFRVERRNIDAEPGHG